MRTRRNTQEVDSRDFTGQTRIIEEAPRKAVEDPVVLVAEPIEVVEGPNGMDEVAALAFAEDVLTILIHPSAEKLPDDPVYVGVNGRGSYIYRNVKTLLKRKYVERLLRAQADNIMQDTTAVTEKEFNRLTTVATQRYPLSVLNDPSPNGGAWLQQITQSA